MNQAVREELAELRLLAKGHDPNTNQRCNAHTGSAFEDFLREEGVLEEVDATATKKVAKFTRRDQVLPQEPRVPIDLIPYSNRKLIELAKDCVCYHCLSWFPPSKIRSWTDDGETAVCPVCDVDSVLASTADSPISIDSLIDYQQANFQTEGLSAGEDAAEMRRLLDAIDRQRSFLVNELPNYLASNHQLFVGTLKYRLREASFDDISKWLLGDDAKRLKLLVSGNEKALMIEILEAEAGVYL